MLLSNMVEGRTLDLRGPDLARGPEVARRWPSVNKSQTMWMSTEINIVRFTADDVRGY